MSPYEQIYQAYVGAAKHRGELQARVAELEAALEEALGSWAVLDDGDPRGRAGPGWERRTELRRLLEGAPSVGTGECTCGSGAHPRRCLKHPGAYEEHVAEINAAYGSRPKQWVESTATGEGVYSYGPPIQREPCAEEDHEWGSPRCVHCGAPRTSIPSADLSKETPVEPNRKVSPEFIETLRNQGAPELAKRIEAAQGPSEACPHGKSGYDALGCAACHEGPCPNEVRCRRCANPIDECICAVAGHQPDPGPTEAEPFGPRPCLSGDACEHKMFREEEHRVDALYAAARARTTEAVLTTPKGKQVMQGACDCIITLGCPEHHRTDNPSHDDREANERRMQHEYNRGFADGIRKTAHLLEQPCSETASTLTLTHDDAQRLRAMIMGDVCGTNRDACNAAFAKLEAFVLAKWDAEEASETGGTENG